MQINNSQNAKLILARLKKFLTVRTDIELSKILKVQPNTISTWKKRNSMDYSLIISICKLYKIDLNLVFLDEEQSNNTDLNNSNGRKEIRRKYTVVKNEAHPE